MQELALPEEHILDRFGIDSIPVGRAFDMGDDYWYEFDLTPEIRAFYPNWFRPKKTGEQSWEFHKDGLMLAKKPKGATFFDGTYFPYLDGYPDSYDNLDWAMGTSLWAAMPAAMERGLATPTINARLPFRKLMPLSRCPKSSHFHRTAGFRQSGSVLYSIIALCRTRMRRFESASQE